jgi:DNA-binding HxlR family transcriptional regulator
MAGGKYDVYAAQCPTRQALDRIADKWTALIVGLLAERTHRFGELRRSIEGISHKVLVQTLRSLERDGLVHRQPLPTKPPTVEYSLTAWEDTGGTARVNPRLGRTAHRRTAVREGCLHERASRAEASRQHTSHVEPAGLRTQARTFR